MGYELRRMIRDGAPAEWSALMRLIAYEIADDARDPNDEGVTPDGKYPWSAIPIEGEWRHGAWRDGLAEICGASPRAISNALTQLCRAGYDMRMPVTDRNGKVVTDKRGRIVYAAKGHALRFWVPPLPPRPAPGGQGRPVADIQPEARESPTRAGRVTLYRGIRMRSRLEASYAAHLDATVGPGKWEYEPTCFAGPTGQWLADFRVDGPDGRAYVELKPASMRESPGGVIDKIARQMSIARLSDPQCVLRLQFWDWRTNSGEAITVEAETADTPAA
jgi:hypothetical protein